MARLAFLIVALLYGLNIYCQIQPPREPQVRSYQPVNGSQPSNSGYNPSYPQPHVTMGATSDDILRQANRNRPPASNAEIIEQMQRDPAYNPSLRNGINNSYRGNRYEEFVRLMQNESRIENPAITAKRLTTDYYKKVEFTKESEAYNSALKQLKNMLNGKQKLSVTECYFLIENAYGNCYLSRQEYYSIIKKSTDFIKTYMKEKGLNAHNNEDVNLAIQKFMGEQLKVSPGKDIEHPTGYKTITHQPFFYDFNDYQGEKDFKNYFLTKCLATGSGQCSSMPAVYLVLAEALGAKAYLTVVPQHSFIKYPDNKKQILNYEPTSNWKLSDKWYQDNFAISSPAMKNRLYLDTLNSRQIVADCLYSLALGYMKKFGVADGKFVRDCIEAAQPQFPYVNIQGRFIESSMLARMLNASMYYAGLRSYDQINRSKDAMSLYAALQKNEELITALGYTPQPAELYNNLLKEHEFKGKIQDSLHISGKQKHSLFSE